MEEEVVELAKLAVLGEDEVGLIIYIVPTNDENSPNPENVPEIPNKVEAVYN